jgi:hypothetical protein
MGEGCLENQNIWFLVGIEDVPNEVLQSILTSEKEDAEMRREG